MTLHPRHIGWCNRLQLLDDFLFSMRGFPGLWNPTVAECARYWRETYPPSTYLRLEPSIWRDHPGSLEPWQSIALAICTRRTCPCARQFFALPPRTTSANCSGPGPWICERGPDAVFIFTGLEHALPMSGDELPFADDEIAPALYFERLKTLALEHLGGSPDRHDVAVFNRMTGATLATHLTLVRPGDVVIGASASHSHPSVVRAANHVGARFVDTAGLAMFQQAIAAEPRVALVDLTRLAVTYDLMPVEEICAIVGLAHNRGALVYMDDAGGARVGPAGFGQPRMLELGVDIGATGLDKYGTVGPRLGLLGGRATRSPGYA